MGGDRQRETESMREREGERRGEMKLGEKLGLGATVPIERRTLERERGEREHERNLGRRELSGRKCLETERQVQKGRERPREGDRWGQTGAGGARDPGTERQR